jgi:hypothetical protein
VTVKAEGVAFHAMHRGERVPHLAPLARPSRHGVDSLEHEADTIAVAFGDPDHTRRADGCPLREQTEPRDLALELIARERRVAPFDEHRFVSVREDEARVASEIAQVGGARRLPCAPEVHRRELLHLPAKAQAMITRPDATCDSRC